MTDHKPSKAEIADFVRARVAQELDRLISKPRAVTAASIVQRMRERYAADPGYVLMRAEDGSIVNACDYGDVDDYAVNLDSDGNIQITYSFRPYPGPVSITLEVKS